MLFPKALCAGTWWGHQEEPGTCTSCHPNVPLGTPPLVPRAATYPTAPTSTQRHRGLEGKGARGPCGSRHSSAREDSRSPITTSTGNTPTTGNCFLSMEIQHNPSLWVLVRLQVTASSYNVEHAFIHGKQQATHRTLIRFSLVKEKKKNRKNNTIQKSSLFSFQHFRSLWRYATLQPCQ